MLRSHPILLPALLLALAILLRFGSGWIEQGRAWVGEFERAGVHLLTKSITEAR